MNYLHYKIGIVLSLLCIGYFIGCYTNQCNVPHALAVEAKMPKIEREEKPDSIKTKIVIQDSGWFAGRATTTTDGKKSIQKTVHTGTATVNIDVELNPVTSEFSGSWTYIAVREITHYFKSIYERVSYVTVQTITLPDTDDWTWFGIGSAVGVALSIITFLLLAL